MGVGDFWTQALGDFHLDEKAKLSKYAGKRIAVDISNWIHAAFHSKDNDAGIAITTVPKYPTRDNLVGFIMDRHLLLVGNNIKPFHVFDGKDHPMKHIRRMERKHIRDKAKSDFFTLVEKAKRGDDITDDDRNKAEKLRRLMAAPDANGYAVIRDKFVANKIPFMVAPFEAEMQLVYLEMNGFVDGILTEDSDAVVLGGKIVLTKVVYAEEAINCRARTFSYAEFFGGASGRNSYRSQLVKWIQCLPEVSSLLGNDYIKRLHGHGVVTVLGKPATESAPAKEGIMDNLTRFA